MDEEVFLSERRILTESASESTYIAAGGNRHPSAADWNSRTGLLAYGADRNVALWDPLNSSQIGVKSLLHGHTDTINAVKFLPTKPDQPQIILSGSADKTIRVWRIPQNTAPPESGTVLEGHSNSVNCFAVSSGSDIVASGAADGTIKIWRVSLMEGGLHTEEIQNIVLSPKCFPLTLALHPFSPPSKELVLAVGGTRSTVQIFVSDAHANFSHQVILTGHEGWIRSLAFSSESTSPDSDLLLASASQDKYIRLWRITNERSGSNSAQPDLLTAFEQALSNKTHRLKTIDASHVLTFEALLLGHGDWIYTVSWLLRDGKLQLLSASEDNSLAIWERDESSGVWTPTTRLGEISSLKGSTTATGSAGGFWIGLWSPTGAQLVSLGRTGSWRLWNFDPSQRRWLQGVGINGHTKPVMDIAWSRDGSYLLSTGSDQTTRLHAEWRRGSTRSWHEMARPQIHGYDLNCIDAIGETQFVSGADEKLLRVFDEPRATAEFLDMVSEIRMDADDHANLPQTANIPVLGLSNKAIDAKTDGEPHGEDAGGSENDEAENAESLPIEEKPYVLEHPPAEDRLARHTLWPEREKLYGHGHEISAVAVNRRGTYVATACKASSQDHAVIRLFRTKDWREIKPPLTAHSLTVTCLRFSEAGDHLLSVGRDRQWAVWEPSRMVHPEEAPVNDSYTLKYSNPKGHSRMILNACWAPSDAGTAFATAGRDKCVKVWSMTGSSKSDVKCVATITEASAVTAVAISPRSVDACWIVALGTETGKVALHFLSTVDWNLVRTQELVELLQPSKSINQLAWRPDSSDTDKTTSDRRDFPQQFQLAIASADSSLRLLTVVCISPILEDDTAEKRVN